MIHVHADQAKSIRNAVDVTNDKQNAVHYIGAQHFLCVNKYKKTKTLKGEPSTFLFV